MCVCVSQKTTDEYEEKKHSMTFLAVATNAI